ncbi:MAG TPA: hypothetical protein VFQ54_09580 [Thermomicrobiales bacterium]|nr:hypothetical protein [Thermomicrobiales bacterium]
MNDATRFSRLRHLFRPSRGNDATAMEFDRQLDALVTGMPAPAPDAASLDTDRARVDVLTATFLQAASLRTAQEVAMTASGRTKARIWEDIMSATASPSLSPAARPFAGPPPSSNSTPIRNVGRSIRTWTARFSPVLNVAMVALMILTLVLGAFAVTNRGGWHPNGGPSGNNLAMLPATVEGTPVAQVDLPTAADCTVKPLTVDEVIDRIKHPYPFYPESPATPVPSQAVYTQPKSGPLSTKDLAEISDVQRQFDACILKGSPFQLWALIIQGSRFWADIVKAYPPLTSEATVRSDLEELLESGNDPNVVNKTRLLIYSPKSLNPYGLPLVNPDPAASIYTEEGPTNVIAPTAEVATLYYDPNNPTAAPTNTPFDQMVQPWFYRWDYSTDSWKIDDIGILEARG